MNLSNISSVKNNSNIEITQKKHKGKNHIDEVIDITNDYGNDPGTSSGPLTMNFANKGSIVKKNSDTTNYSMYTIYRPKINGSINQ